MLMKLSIQGSAEICSLVDNNNNNNRVMIHLVAGSSGQLGPFHLKRTRTSACSSLLLSFWLLSPVALF